MSCLEIFYIPWFDSPPLHLLQRQSCTLVTLMTLELVYRLTLLTIISFTVLIDTLFEVYQLLIMASYIMFIST
jgi:hypothetical protein